MDKERLATIKDDAETMAKVNKLQQKNVPQTIFTKYI